MERFRICDDCARHVRANESSCPFCGHALAEAALPPLVRAPAQLSRAQRIAFVAAIASGPMLAACGDDDMGKASAPIAVPVYGAPVPPQQPLAGQGGEAGKSGGAAGRNSGSAGRNGGAAGARPPIAVPVYGAPVPPPAGQGGGAGSAGKGSAGGGGAAGSGGSAGKPAAGSGGSAGAAGSGGSAGKAAGGSGGQMVVPVYGASPAYGVPPSSK